MTAILKQDEAAPTSYPVLSPTVPDEVWQRIESYIAHRYTERSVVWTVQGPGEWHAPLKPAAVTKVEIWSDGGWEDITANAPDASPVGGYCIGHGPYRFTATVGGGSPAPTVPAIVAQAAQRLAAYMASKPGTAGAKSESIDAGSISISRSRSESWMAKALQNSGAADLLRTYRRV